MLKEKGLLLLDKPGVERGFLEILWSGDKAGDTYLFNFHVINIENAQSSTNARCALMFAANDCYSNLKDVFEFAKTGKSFDITIWKS